MAAGSVLVRSEEEGIWSGKAEIVVQDAAAYQRLLALAEKAEMMEFLREAKADADAGRTVPAREFLQSLREKKKARKA